MEKGHWTAPDFKIEDYVGFVYVITNPTGKQYVGRKVFLHTKKKPPLKGRVNKRHTQVDSKWQYYTGSSKELNAEIEIQGVDNFTFVILHLCKSKMWMSYYEAKEIFTHDTLFTGYNKTIPAVRNRP